MGFEFLILQFISYTICFFSKFEWNRFFTKYKFNICKRKRVIELILFFFDFLFVNVMAETTTAEIYANKLIIQSCQIQFDMKLYNLNVKMMKYDSKCNVFNEAIWVLFFKFFRSSCWNFCQFTIMEHIAVEKIF